MIMRVLVAVMLVAGAALAPETLAQARKIKIGVVYDYSGPLAGGGSDLHALGAKIMIDYFAKRGGVENRNLEYGFRVQASGRQFGLMSMDFSAKNAKAKLGKEPKDLKVAIIHEDGAYGIDVSKGNEEGARKAGFNLVLKEGYAATAPDLASLVIKLKRARPDVLFHTGYNPEIALFLRQAREQGLRFSALVGHGAGYGVYDKLKEAVGKDVNFIFNVDPISIWLANEKALRPELLPVI